MHPPTHTHCLNQKNENLSQAQPAQHIEHSQELWQLTHLDTKLAWFQTDLILSHDNMGVVPPPMTHTVKKTMSSVVVNIIWRA